ncbi:MAG: L,D-transpeptidase family protein, partial [Pseudomonadota bacterium]
FKAIALTQKGSPDYQAKIIDNGKVTFQTKSVVGHVDLDRRTPEFSDVMEYLVINPTWNVPRSIATKEYLPLLQENPNAVGHLRLVDARGRVVGRDGIDFSQFDEKTFPFDLKEPPSQGNALGLVKFMFPNRHNIYLHDTPAKRLFGRETRAFSHGCVRLNDPFDFAYELLSKQERNPQAFFRTQLNTGKETFVNLDEHVPVHLVYRTAFTQAKGATQFRRDVYGRDAKIWKALENAGVALRGLRG